MKKLLMFLVAFWVFGTNYAQEQSDHKGGVLSGGSVYKDASKNLQMQFQIGSVFQYPSNVGVKTKAGFPFGVLYVPNTFSEKTFEVSKGYFADAVKLSWSIGANESNITKIQVYRKELRGSGAYNLVATLGKDVFEFNDTQIEGGVLYQYKVEAVGVSNFEQKYLTFIEGIGFRSPTANVSGLITYKGGSPVKDVKVLAEAVGAEGKSSGYATHLQGNALTTGLLDSQRGFDVNELTVEGWITFQSKFLPVWTLNLGGADMKLEMSTPNYQGKKIIDFYLFSPGSGQKWYRLKNVYPTGNVDTAGNDVFASIESIDANTFVHIAVVFKEGTAYFYLNGRLIDQDYVNNVVVPEGAERPVLEVVKEELTKNLSNTRFNALTLGSGGYTAYFDEMRVWSKARKTDEIRRDFKRYIGGNESGLEMYYRFDEGYGSYSYDISKKGLKYNKRNLANTNYNLITYSSTVKPTKEQLGVYGITDKDGTYVISAIPYAGTGEQFKITPSLGVHKFNPASQTLFLGKDEPVANKIDFEDISSFKFNGRVVFDTRNVFKDEAFYDPAVNDSNPILKAINKDGGTIREIGYNQYLINETTTIFKGEYFYEANEGETVTVDTNTGNLTGGTLKKYSVIGVEDANLYIDGNLVYDEDNQPVVTDVDGKFVIDVPIGKHKIEVRKQGHTFTYEGRFPEKTEDTTKNLFEFYEDQIQERWFIDNTRVTVVGRIVGGRIENKKEIGFGFDGLKKHENEVADDEPKNTQIYSSVNNIGQATLTLRGDLNTNAYDHIITTNAETGEYRAELIPYKYYVEQNNGINVINNSDINSSFLDSNEELDFTKIKEETTSIFKAEDKTEIESEPYQYEKSFRYDSDVTLQLISQASEENIKINGETYTFKDTKTGYYKQKNPYSIVFEVSQNYVNKDVTPNEVVKEYYNEGEFSITNNFEVASKSTIKTVKKSNKIQYEYTFTAGFPSTNKVNRFEKAIDVQYDIEGSNSIGIANISEFKDKGVILGAGESNGTIFSTVAPDKPDIILRDPPGSSSFATIEKGTSISFEKSSTDSDNTSLGKSMHISVGPKFTSSVGIGFMTETEVEVIASVNTGITRTTETTTSGTSIQTYSFNQTISTSDEPDFVGAGGDLYIGASENIYYGMIDKVEFSKDEPFYDQVSSDPAEAVPSIVVTVKDKDDNDVDVYLGARKTFFIANQPTQTVFIYSQNYILDELIPSFENLAKSAPVEMNVEQNIGENAIRTKNFYYKQIALWKKIIQENERKKYLAFSDKEQAKANVENIINNLPEKADKAGLQNLLNNNFFVNRSIDTGVGEFTSSYSTTRVEATSYENVIDLSIDFQAQLGAYLNNLGRSHTFDTNKSFTDVKAGGTSAETTTTISYTLKDNSKFNSLSVDVINMFDGNGAVFATKAGYTSCPYEGAEEANFFKNDTYNKDVVGEGGELLSASTVSVFKPEVTIEKSKLRNIPESNSAVFLLKVTNNSPTGNDLEHIIFLNNADLQGATTNIDQNGMTLFLPFGEEVEVPVIIDKNVNHSRFVYDNIKVYIGDSCESQEDIIDVANQRVANSEDNDSGNDNHIPQAIRVDLSVEFKKSCSKVTVSAPQENWVFNRNEAFSYDANGEVTEKKLPITFTDFNTDFAGFRKIILEYRDANSSQWTKLKTYYKQGEIPANETDALEIGSDSEITFNWDIVGKQITDGNYEIRGVAYCTDNVVYESKVIRGTINLTPPVVFGTPQPSDGILNIGEDIKVRFNENIATGAFTNITLRGLKNQQSIDHSVSVRLDGSVNQIELPKQNLHSKSTTVQFWFNNATTASGTLLSQEDGISATLNGNALTFSIAGSSVTANIVSNEYNFYSLVYKDGNTPYLEILKNGDVLKTEYLSGELSFTTSNSIFIGGTGVEGNIHDVRIWQKATTPGQAAAEKDFTLTGKEPKLLGYWMLNEGNGIIGHEKVRRKNAKVGLSWTIKPKGQGYEFANSDYLTLDNVGFVQPTNYEDITMSFWVKAGAGESGTIFGNGTGNENPGEPLLTNGFRNKWDVSLGTNGMVTLRAEGVDYQLTNTSIADNNWHHIALVVRRSGSINSYIDGEQHLSVSSTNIGGIAGSKLYVGARYKRYIPVDNNGTVTGNATETIENHFTGKLDELRLWNTARSYEQLKRDRYFELDRETTGLLLYVNFNEDEANVATKGPRYNVRKGDGTTVGFLSLLNDGNGTTRSFIEDSPSIKPALAYINVPYTTVINGDEMIISPSLTADQWSLFEGQILDVSVAGMYDVHYNKQLSPVSFSAYVNRQEVEWFTNAGTKEIVAEKEVNQPYSFTMDVINKGGNNQDFTVSGLPVWMKVSATSATVGANAMKQLTFTVDKELAMGSYTADIYLQLEDGYSDRLLLDLRVLQRAPDWSVNPSSYSNSMNIISQIRIQNVLSRDTYTKVGAFVNDEKRGEAYLVYDKGYDSYYAFLTVYSNVSSGETVTFKVWDALNGKTSIATINNLQSIPFVQNEVMGTYTSPTIFSTDELSEQNIQLNKGWTWVSFFVEDTRFNDIGNTLEGLDLSNGDVIKNGLQFTNYQNGIWAGSLTALENNKAYRIKLEKANSLRLIGQEVKLDQLSISVAKGWNRLSFPVHKNISVQEAMAFYEPTSGDVLKDQYSFAIYDANSGEWKGTLRYMQSNRGYMLSAGKAQTFKYPKIDYVSKSASAGQPHTNEMINNFSKYSSNMGIVAEIVTQEQFDEVHVFDTKGILRGKSKIVEQNGKQLSFITVFSNTQENLTYTLVSANKQVDLSEGFTFSNNLLLGTLENPVQLGGSVLSTNDVNFEGITLYPNPFEDELIINIPNTSKITKAILYSAIGVKVKEVTITTKVTKIATHKLSSGVYMLQLIDKSGNTSVRKLIKQ